MDDDSTVRAIMKDSVKVGSHDPTTIQLTLKFFVCVMKFVGVHTIQFLHPIIS